MKKLKLEKRVIQKGNYEVKITIPGDEENIPDLKSLPGMIDIPKCCLGTIVFTLGDDVASDWKFSKFIIRPLAPRSNADDFSIGGNKGAQSAGVREFSVNGSAFTVVDENEVPGFFKYDLIATHKDGWEVDVDPGIGNGGQK